MTIDKEKYLAAFSAKIESYAPVSEKSLSLLIEIAQFQTLYKGELLLQEGQLATNLHFVCKGAIRAYVTDPEGNSYNKNIFLENYFSASTVSLLRHSPSRFTLEALEDTILLNLNYKKYRQLISENEDLKNYYIAYLEQNWVIEKEEREISLVMENATDRYLKLLQAHPDIDKRIPQLHIAAHLGITPTQLSRIRKELKKIS